LSKSHRLVSLAIILSLLSVLPATSPALSDSDSFVTGSLKAVDETPVSGVQIRFVQKIGKSFGPSIISTTDNSGKFILRVPMGDYEVNIQKGLSQDSRCLNAQFAYTVSQPRQSLDIKTPRLTSLLFEFTGGMTNDLVGGVAMDFRSLKYAEVSNPAISDPSFYCSFLIASGGKSPYIVVDAFELGMDQSFQGTSQTGLSYRFKDGLGQLVAETVPQSALGSPRVRVGLSDLPSVNLSRKSLKISGNKLVGLATFNEAKVLEEFGLTRKLNIMFRVTRGKKVSPWITRNSRLSVDAKSKVDFALNARFYRGTLLEILLVGDNFSAASNVVTFRIPK